MRVGRETCEPTRTVVARFFAEVFRKMFVQIASPGSNVSVVDVLVVILISKMNPKIVQF